MNARRATAFVSVALILAGLSVGVTAVLARLMASAPPPPPPAALASSLALPLDHQGLGAQVLEGTSFTVRVAPWPAPAGRPVTVSLVVISPDGQLPVFPAALFVARAGIAPGAGLEMRRLPAGGYEYAGVLFPTSGDWQLTLDAPLEPGRDWSIPVNVTAQ